MKHEPQETEIMQRMAAGALAAEGFLGNDSRGLYEIIDADSAAVRDMGTNSEQIAARLADILAAAIAGMGRQVNLSGGRLLATWQEAMGRIPCPFGHGRLFAKGEVLLTDTVTGQSLRFTPLSVHLVGEHDFYQGLHSRYRLDPDILCNMLDLP